MLIDTYSCILCMCMKHNTIIIDSNFFVLFCFYNNGVCIKISRSFLLHDDIIHMKIACTTMYTLSKWNFIENCFHEINAIELYRLSILQSNHQLTEHELIHLHFTGEKWVMK